MLTKKRLKKYRNIGHPERTKVKNSKYRGIGLFKYRASVRFPWVWQSVDPFKACPILSINTWNKMRKVK